MVNIYLVATPFSLVLGILTVLPSLNLAFAESDSSGDSFSTLEQLIHAAQEKINRATEFSKNAWNSYNYSKCGLSLDYPSSMNLTEKTNRFETNQHISFKNFTAELNISCNENTSFNNTNGLENYLNNSKFLLLKSQNPVYTLVEDVNLTKWNIDGKKAGSIVYGSETNGDALKGNELISVFDGRKLINIKFIADADKFDLPKTQAIEKRMINSIKWLGTTINSNQENKNDSNYSKINNQSSVLSPNPIKFITKWGSNGTGNGQFDHPGGVAIDSSGNVYVADSGNNRIQKFDSNGNFITKWGSNGTGNGQFDHPSDIVVDTSGNVYVDDSGNFRIQKFDSNGNFITKWGSNGTGNGQFDHPSDIVVDTSGNVYVDDSGNFRIQKFDSNGNFITKWGGSVGEGDGQFHGTYNIAVDTSGNVYVADTYNNRIQKFDSNGTFIKKLESDGTYEGHLHHPSGIAVDSSGNVYVADYSNFVDIDNERIQKFDSNDYLIKRWGSSGSDDGQFSQTGAITVDSSGNVYVADSGNNRIQKFDSNGNFITKWGSNGTGNGQFEKPRYIAVDPSDKVYVIDNTDRIQVFSLVTNNSPTSGGKNK